ncbi:MAG: signal peptidase I [Lachnospiraceae bacterium]|nr:signal peptidase I [Lachnospiraceae bacterium]
MNTKLIFKICQIVTGIAFSVALAFIIIYTFFAVSLQQGFSMAPYINNGNVVFVNRLYKNFLPLERKDVIVFYLSGQESIRRICGLPGETVSISKGNLYIDDVLIDTIDLKNSLSSNIDQNVKLGDDEYYVLGDNLDSSNDSRFADVGNIKRANIKGKVWYVIR